MKYNAAATALRPPRTELSWDEVVEYAFLADFDLLRDARQDIRSRPWATPAARQAMDGYFKLLRADEEITRLNLEIRRFLTFMRDEDAELCSKEKEVGLTDPALAYQIRVHRTYFSRFSARHLKNLTAIRQLPGFTGDMSCGVHTPEPSLAAAPSSHTEPIIFIAASSAGDGHIDVEADLEEEQAGEDEEQAVMGAYCSILEFTCDRDTST